MTGPWTTTAPLIGAVPVGIAFGWALERSGLGSTRTIADQLSGRDFTVIKVMFSAIVTAMLGLFWAERLGYLDLRQVAIPPTDLLPQLLGSVIFGAGFAVASLCPGTACVAAGTGKREGFGALGGILLGTVAAVALRPLITGVFTHALREGAVLPTDLGLPVGVVTGSVVFLALVAIAVADRVEGSATGLRVGPLAATAGTLGTLAIFTGGGTALPATSLAAIAGEVAAERDHVDPVELAEWIRAGRPGLRVIDVRDGLTGDTYRIPGAEDHPLDRIASLVVAPGATIVLYSEGGAHAAQAWVLLRARGATNVYVLRDGLAAWEDEVLAPRPPATTDPHALARFQRARELAHWFGGRPRLDPAPEAAPNRVRRRNSC